MDETEVADFWRGAKQPPRRLTRAEKAFIQASVRRTHDHWQGASDVARMEQLLEARLLCYRRSARPWSRSLLSVEGVRRRWPSS